MIASPVRVVAGDSPPGFVETAANAVPRPPLSGGSGATFTQWTAARAAGESETLLFGCVATPIPGWVDDMRPAVDARTVGLMTASAERAAGVPVETRARANEEGSFDLRLVGAPADAPRAGIARIFVGWGDGAVSTCFAVCTGTRCEPAVLGARLEGSAGPPPPGIVLGAAAWAVHHPSNTVLWGGGIAFVLGVVAVASRRRPRSRI